MKIYENLDINDLDGEVWKDILDYESDYQVNNIGRVKSFKQDKINGKILKQWKNNNGRFQINLYKNGKGEPKLVHRLVYETHKGKLEEGYDVHHINEDEKDNFINNLEKMPKSKHLSFHHKGKKLLEEIKLKIGEKNKGKSPSLESRKKMSDSHSGEKNHNFGKNFYGENNPNYKIVNPKRIDIKNEIKIGKFSQRQIAKKYGVSRGTVQRIKREILCSQ